MTVRSPRQLLEFRRAHVNPTLSVAYDEPLKIVRGEGAYLFDDNGRRYLDMVNNVCHVGHCHPSVVQAGQRQMALLNTNTRYLHDNLVDYVQALLKTFPADLDVVFLTNSGTEANDLALRLARAYTGGNDVVVLDHAYHGHSPSMVDLSPYKFDGKGGAGRPGHVQVVPMPDVYRGMFRADDPACGKGYADLLPNAIAAIHAHGAKPAAFYCESLPGCGGQIMLPDGYLHAAYRHVRAAGGLCLADEVQVGFGRVGDHWWAFERQGVVPDIVTLGKPIGNGHPIGAVVTRREIADAFVTGMEYFNTFGGNPVSCAIASAVLDVIEAEDLCAHASRIGARLMQGLQALSSRHALIGDVRGAGLFIGVELVLDRVSLAPATVEARQVSERMKQSGVLLSTDGPLDNVLKIKPPMVLDTADADHFLDALDQAFAGL